MRPPWLIAVRMCSSCCAVLRNIRIRLLQRNLLWLGAWFCLLLESCCTTPLPPIPNLHTVDADKVILRGGQPTAQGWTNIWLAGVRSVVKLNTDAEGSDNLAERMGMKVYRFPISVGEQLEGGPKVSTVAKAVAIMQVGHCYVHCGSDSRTRSRIDAVLKSAGGNDRTGLVCGVYRVWSDHWTEATAYVEMKQYGFHPILKGLYDWWNKNVE
jgi:hypothetical protein